MNADKRIKELEAESETIRLLTEALAESARNIHAGHRPAFDEKPFEQSFAECKHRVCVASRAAIEMAYWPGRARRDGEGGIMNADDAKRVEEIRRGIKLIWPESVTAQSMWFKNTVYLLAQLDAARRECERLRACCDRYRADEQGHADALMAECRRAEKAEATLDAERKVHALLDGGRRDG